ncbi:MAG TPA: hypothetical protein VEH27_12200 [Methylomirabilota bacterium]|nr:hypothetical protein [Methylomirabilota bacterium]
MKFLNSFFAVTALAAAALSAFAAPVPPPEQLLPGDTIGFLSVPDWSKQAQGYNASAYGQLLADQSMKPFNEKFVKGFTTDVVEPLEKELGVKFKDYQELLQGQLTLAILPTEEKNKMSWALLLDSKDKQTNLTTRLTELKKRWTDTGKQVKSEKIRDIEFTSITFTSEDVEAVFKKAFPRGAKSDDQDEQPTEKKNEKQTITLGQSGSLLLVGDNTKTLEKILSRLSGGLVNPLAEQSSYAKDARLFRNSLVVGWFNWKPLYQRLLEEAKPDEDADQPAMINPQQVLGALGLDVINSLAFSGNYGNDGMFFELSLSAPEAARKGLLKMIAPDAQDASPPPTVPADAVQFQRWRLNLPQVWDQLEATIKSVSPQAAGVMNLVLGTLGKDKDPNFDFRKSLIGNLGNDIISVQKPPKAATLEALQNAPSIVMLGSPKPEELASALTSLSSMMGPTESGNSPFKEREFLGKKIYSITAPDRANPEKTRTLSYAASGGYVVFSTDAAALEEHLRSAEKPAKSLRDTAGLREAAEKVGGMSTGMFGFENQAESARTNIELLKKDPKAASRLLFGLAGEEGEDNKMAEWMDFSLLPNYDQIAKYFGLSVFSFGGTADGLSIRAYAPQPAAIKK